MTFSERIAFESLMEPVALRLLGEPNKALSKYPTDMRWGANGSLSVNYETGQFYDHEADLGGGVIDFLQHKGGHDRDGAIAWLRREGLLRAAHTAPPKATFECAYDYTDESGELLFQVLRYSNPKTFKQRRPGEKHDEWNWKLGDVRRVLYRLPQLIAATQKRTPVFLVEGEKDADNLAGLGFTATTNPGGANKWRDEYTEVFHGASVIVIPDHDDAGREHVDKIIASLRGVAQRIRVLDLKTAWPECADKGDISDWIDAGGNKQELIELVKALPDWQPARESGAANHPTPEIISNLAKDIAPEKVEWLWPGRLARGKHTCLAGEQGTGKSQLSIAIIAAITTGGTWPCAEGRSPIKGNVIILSAEDGASDTIVPRLMAAGADLGRVHIVSAVRNIDRNGQRTFNLQTDIESLGCKIAEIGDVALVNIDPVSSYLGKIDSHKNSEVRGVLEPLAEMADRTRVAVLSITHFSKPGSTSTAKALHRIIGSTAFTAAPRVALAVIEDAENQGRYLVLHAKNNLAPPPQGLAYRLEQTIIGGDIVASRTVWETEPVTMTANQAMAAEVGGTEGGRVINEAREFLEETLASGPLPQKEVKAAAEGAGISWPSVRRAKERLGVTAVRESVGASGAGRWLWSLPARPTQDPQGAQGAHFSNVGTLHQNGHFSGEGEHLAKRTGTVAWDTFGTVGHLDGNGAAENNDPPDLGIPPFLRRENPRAESEIRHPAISSGPDDDLADFAPDLNE